MTKAELETRNTVLEEKIKSLEKDIENLIGEKRNLEAELEIRENFFNNHVMSAFRNLFWFFKFSARSVAKPNQKIVKLIEAIESGQENQIGKSINSFKIPVKELNQLNQLVDSKVERIKEGYKYPF